MIGLIDTNVLVYAYNKASPFHKIAKEFITDIIRDQKRAYVSDLNLYEFYSVITDTRKIERSLSPKEAAEIIRRIIKSETIKVLYCDKRAIKQLSELAVDHSIKRYHVYDLAIVSIMRVNGIKKIITANEGDFKPFDFIEVENPFAEIIKSLKAKRKKRFLPYGRQWIEDDEIEAVVKVLRSDWITQGPKIEEFERRIAEYCGARFAVATSSGTAALHMACLAAGIGKDDEVVTSPITFVASSNCVLYCGGRPIFADIEEDTANIDPDEIKKRITEKTRAIIPVHFAGQPCEMEAIRKIAEENNLLIIEDACHALGAEYRIQKSEVRSQKSKNRSQRAEGRGQRSEEEKTGWVKVGNCKYSDMTVFSFHPVKHITTGEGGAILTNDEELYKRLRIFRNHGITRNSEDFVNTDPAFPQSAIRNPQFPSPWYYEMQELGYNYRITDFQCALGIAQLERLDQFVERRREIAAKYTEAFKNMEEVITPCEREDVRSSYHLYVIQVKSGRLNRREVFENLRDAGIGVQVHYIPVHLQPYYQQNLGYKRGDYPRAESFYERALSLPLFPRMSNEEVERVIKAVQNTLIGGVQDEVLQKVFNA